MKESVFMTENGKKTLETPGKRLWLLIILAILCIGLEIGVHLFLRTAIGYTHIFYLLLVLAAIWYYQKAVFVAVILAAVTFFTSLYVGDFTWATILRASMFILVTYVVGRLSEERDLARREIEEKHFALVGYLSEAAIRLKNPLAILRDNLSNILSHLSGESQDLESARMELSVQIAHTNQILANIQELNQEIVDHRQEIPKAYREFLIK
ncbi:MAG: hypothetical protein LUQ12_01855 [Methanoregulaceae archaeon]|nr:hypothetical protein [Methanoregulaceae archaeon]